MLRLEGASVDIAGVPVLRGVSLHVPPGGRVALIGRNGAGKTTTLRALMGLLTLRGGSVAVAGEDASDVPAHFRARLGVGYAPEDRRLFGSFTVQDNMLLPAQVLKLAPAETARRMEAVFTLLPELRDLRWERLCAPLDETIVRAMRAANGASGDRVALTVGGVAHRLLHRRHEPRLRDLVPRRATLAAGARRHQRGTRRGGNLSNLTNSECPRPGSIFPDRLLRHRNHTVQRHIAAAHGWCAGPKPGCAIPDRSNTNE